MAQDIENWQARLDTRSTYSRVTAELGDGKIWLRGETLDEAARSAAEAFVKTRFPNVRLVNCIQLLLEGAEHATVGRALMSLRSKPDEHAALLSQALFGEPVEILKRADKWALVRLAMDGYIGWSPSHALYPSVSDHTSTHRVRSPLALARLDSGHPASLLPMLARVRVTGHNGRRVAIDEPAGGRWWLPDRAVERTSLSPAGKDLSISLAITRFMQMIGTPYLWGGRSSFGFDCSGLAQSFLSALGATIPRDADQQWDAGSPTSSVSQGDLLFFGRAGYIADGIARREGVNHVAISTGGDDFLHATASVWGVARGSLDSKSPHFSSDLRSAFMGARRYR